MPRSLPIPPPWCVSILLAKATATPKCNPVNQQSWFTYVQREPISPRGFLVSRFCSFEKDDRINVWNHWIISKNHSEVCTFIWEFSDEKMKKKCLFKMIVLSYHSNHFCLLPTCFLLFFPFSKPFNLFVSRYWHFVAFSFYFFFNYPFGSNSRSSMQFSSRMSIGSNPLEQITKKELKYFFYRKTKFWWERQPLLDQIGFE